MARTKEPGIFTMDLITKVTQTRDLVAAKQLAVAAIDAAETARSENKERARTMVRQSATINQLAIGMSNFSLSFQGYKVIR